MSRLVGTRGPDQDSHKHIFTDFTTGLWIWVAPCPSVLYKFKQAGTKGSKVCFSSNQTHAGLYRIVFLLIIVIYLISLKENNPVQAGGARAWLEPQKSIEGCRKQPSLMRWQQHAQRPSPQNVTNVLFGAIRTSAKAPKTIFGLTAAHNLFSFVSIVVGIVGVVVVVVVAVVFVHPLSLSCAFADKGVQWNLVQNMPSAAGVEIKLQNKWGIHIYIKRQSNA